jgi:hypothetical protein
VVDGLGQAALEDLGLQPALEEILDLEGEHVIEAHAGLVEHPDAHEAADEGVTLEKTLGVLVVELEELTRGTPDLGEDERDTPDLALVAEAVFTRELGTKNKYQYPDNARKRRREPSAHSRGGQTRTAYGGRCICRVGRRL